MRRRGTSDVLKYHHRILHLIRYDPERWEQERGATPTRALGSKTWNANRTVQSLVLEISGSTLEFVLISPDQRGIQYAS